MKLSCLRENLSQALSLVGGITGKNANLPILSNVLLRSDKQGLEIVATNLELATVVVVRAKIETPGTFTVPARTLIDFVNLVSGDRLDLELVGNELLISSGKTTTKIKGTASDEFPVIPEPTDGEGYVVQFTNLKDALQAVAPAMAKNDIRPELAGVYVGFKKNNSNNVVFAATDSYRLAEKQVPLEQGNVEKSIIIPGRSTQEISRLLAVVGPIEESGVRIIVSENQLVVNYGPAHIVSRLVSGSYPDYAQIIPAEFKTTVIAPIAELSKEVKAAGLFSTTGVNAVLLQTTPVTGTLQISSTSTQTGDYQSELPVKTEGDENKILLNHHYLLDGLNQLAGGEAKIQIISHEAPCLLTGTSSDSFRYVVMPIRQ